MPLTDNVGVAVLIGGKSSRMGSPKEQLITKDNQSFLMRICSEMDFFKYRYISHNSSQKYSYISHCIHPCHGERAERVGPFDEYIGLREPHPVRRPRRGERGVFGCHL